MYNMAIRVNHDVSVVPILDLQQVANHRVRCHRFDEIAARRQKFLGRFVAVLVQEVVHQIRVRLATQLIARLGIRHALNDTALDQGII